MVTKKDGRIVENLDEGAPSGARAFRSANFNRQCGAGTHRSRDSVVCVVSNLRSSVDPAAKIPVRSGYADGGREAKLRLLALGKGFEQSQAIGCAQHRTRRGRVDLLAQRAVDCEIDVGDMSCRIMLSVAISASKSSRR
jgi:hypothetical protein